MTVVDVLKAARRALLGGWIGPGSAPFSFDGGVDSQGRPVHWNDEGIFKFTVHGAICSAARGDEQLVRAVWDELERIVSPIWRAQSRAKLPEKTAPKAEWQAYFALQLQPSGLLDVEWFEAEGRTIAEVSRAFERAIISAKGRTNGN